MPHKFTKLLVSKRVDHQHSHIIIVITMIFRPEAERQHKIQLGKRGLQQVKSEKGKETDSRSLENIFFPHGRNSKRCRLSLLLFLFILLWVQKLQQKLKVRLYTQHTWCVQHMNIIIMQPVESASRKYTTFSSNYMATPTDSICHFFIFLFLHFAYIAPKCQRLKCTYYLIFPPNPKKREKKNYSAKSYILYQFR